MLRSMPLHTQFLILFDFFLCLLFELLNAVHHCLCAFQILRNKGFFCLGVSRSPSVLNGFTKVVLGCYFVRREQPVEDGLCYGVFRIGYKGYGYILRTADGCAEAPLLNSPRGALLRGCNSRFLYRDLSWRSPFTLKSAVQSAWVQSAWAPSARAGLHLIYLQARSVFSRSQRSEPRHCRG